MRIETFPVGPLECNCTILSDEAAGEAIVIDPGDDIAGQMRPAKQPGAVAFEDGNHLEA